MLFRSLGQLLAEQLRKQVPDSGVCLVDAERVDRDLVAPGLARSSTLDPATAADANHRIAIYLDELEAAHDYVLLLADDMMQVRILSRRYSWSRSPYARRWMTRILLFKPSTKPSETLFSGLQ